MKKSFILEEALLHEVATWMHHTLASFLSLKWLASSLTCRDFHNNSESVMYMIELATAESNTQFIPDLIVPACCQQQCVSWQVILAFRYTTRTHSPFNCIAEFFWISSKCSWIERVCCNVNWILDSNKRTLQYSWMVSVFLLFT